MKYIIKKENFKPVCDFCINEQEVQTPGLNMILHNKAKVISELETIKLTIPYKCPCMYTGTLEINITKVNNVLIINNIEGGELSGD